MAKQKQWMSDLNSYHFAVTEPLYTRLQKGETYLREWVFIMSC
ncbi:hypothetical protein [Acinetobacter baumannii]|nr:hypothetical protein [Acinetobacter baumannii]